MCGICGRLDFEPGADRTAVVKAMRDEMVHRGPDDAGLFRDQAGGMSVCLGHRRLSIIDLSEAACQPMTNEDETFSIVHNGEIYNFRQLRGELESLGHAFRSHSDTEVALHCVEEWGPEAVKRFRGMFAFAAWDKRAGRLILARDRVGKKPLFYYQGQGFVSFSSSLGSLLRDPDVPGEIDPRSLDLYLTYQYVPAPRTIFKGVKKLPPAHVMIIDKKGVSIERYWRVDFGRKIEVREEEAAELVLDKLREAVKLRLVSDVPLGAFLSGGMDSAIVVALMAEEAGKVKTFSIGFDEEVYNELPDAAKVAKMYFTDHHEFVVRPRAAEVLPMLVRHFGEPFADSSAIPTFYVAKETRSRVTVALSGDGGDESFAGYDRYLAQKIACYLHGMPAPLRKHLARLGRSLPEPQTIRHPLRRAKRFLEAAAEDEKARYLRWICHFHPAIRPALYRPELMESLAGFDPRGYLFDVMGRARGAGCVDRLQETDILTYLPEDLLVKADVATMAVSLEGRSPFLDHELVELAASLPAKYKLRRLSTKRLLKKIFSGMLPPGHTERPKRGFGVPISTWLKGELGVQARDLVFSRGSLSRRFFRMDTVSKLFDEHHSGASDHGYRLYSLLMLELWHREVASGR